MGGREVGWGRGSGRRTGFLFENSRRELGGKERSFVKGVSERSNGGP